MSRSLRSVARLTAEEWRVFAEALLLTPIAVLAVRLVGIDRASRIVRCIFPKRTASSLLPARASVLVNFAVTHLLGRCLTKALVLHAVLSRRSLESSLVVGVAVIEGRFHAHAWVESEGRILIGAGERRYHPLWSISVANAT